MNPFRQMTIAVAAVALVTGCSTTPREDADTLPSASSLNKSARVAESRDGSFTGEIVGEPAGKFVELLIGMDMSETQEIMGRTPDRFHTYESGKRWIPFYFGNDARRMQVLYKGEGCLIFTGGNVWGSAGGDLIQIEFDPSGACYQP